MSQRKFIILADPRAVTKPPDGPRRIESTKDIKKARKKAAGPKISKAEQRKQEREEQEAIRRELDKEKSLRKAREARERKKAKEEAVRQDKRKKGLPTVDVRPSQGTLPGLFRIKPAKAAQQSLEEDEEEEEEESQSDDRSIIIDVDSEVERTILDRALDTTLERIQQKTSATEQCFSPGPKDPVDDPRPRKRRKTAVPSSQSRDEDAMIVLPEVQLEVPTVTAESYSHSKMDPSQDIPHPYPIDSRRVPTQHHPGSSSRGTATAAYPSHSTSDSRPRGGANGRPGAQDGSCPRQPEAQPRQPLRGIQPQAPGVPSRPPNFGHDASACPPKPSTVSAGKKPLVPTTTTQVSSLQYAQSRRVWTPARIGVTTPKSCPDIGPKRPTVSMPPPPRTGIAKTANAPAPYFRGTTKADMVVSNVSKVPPRPPSPPNQHEQHRATGTQATRSFVPPGNHQPSMGVKPKYQSNSPSTRRLTPFATSKPVGPPPAPPRLKALQAGPLAASNPRQFLRPPGLLPKSRSSTENKPPPPPPRVPAPTHSILPSSTQALAQDVDKWFPSPTQEAREIFELDISPPKRPSAPTANITTANKMPTTTRKSGPPAQVVPRKRSSFPSLPSIPKPPSAIAESFPPISTQDLFMSTQDIEEVEDEPPTKKNHRQFMAPPPLPPPKRPLHPATRPPHHNGRISDNHASLASKSPLLQKPPVPPFTPTGHTRPPPQQSATSRPQAQDRSKHVDLTARVTPPAGAMAKSASRASSHQRPQHSQHPQQQQLRTPGNAPRPPATRPLAAQSGAPSSRSAPHNRHKSFNHYPRPNLQHATAAKSNPPFTAPDKPGPAPTTDSRVETRQDGNRLTSAVHGGDTGAITDRGDMARLSSILEGNGAPLRKSPPPQSHLNLTPAAKPLHSSGLLLLKGSQHQCGLHRDRGNIIEQGGDGGGHDNITSQSPEGEGASPPRFFTPSGVNMQMAMARHESLETHKREERKKERKRLANMRVKKRIEDIVEAADAAQESGFNDAAKTAGEMGFSQDCFQDDDEDYDIDLVPSSQPWVDNRPAEGASWKDGVDVRGGGDVGSATATTTTVADATVPASQETDYGDVGGDEDEVWGLLGM